MSRRLRFKLSDCECNVYPGEKDPEVEDTPTISAGNDDIKDSQTYPREVPTLQSANRLPSYSLLYEEGLIRAVISDDIRLLNQASRKQTFEPNQLFSRDGTPALTVATAFNNRTVMRILLDEGFDIDCLAPSGQYQGLSPLHVACSLGHTSAFNLLIDRGADIELVTSATMANGDTGKGGQTCLHLAVKQNHTYLCNIIVSMHKDLANVADREGQTPLHIACVLGHLSLVRLLLRSGCDVNMINQNGANCERNNTATPILHAIIWKQFSSARLLLGKADLGITCDCNYGRELSPLHVSTIIGETQLVSDLLDHGADPEQLSGRIFLQRWRYDSESLKAVHIAAFKGYVDVFEKLVNTTDMKDKRFPHITPLCLAVASNQYNMVRYLLSDGYDVNETVAFEDVRGFTALHVATEMGHTDIIEHLLLKNADPNLCTKTTQGKATYQTPLHLACLKQNTEAIRLLGPVTNWDLLVKNGSDPLLDSILLNQSGIVELLLSLRYELLSSKSKLPVFNRVSFAVDKEDDSVNGTDDSSVRTDDSSVRTDDISRTSDGALLIRLSCSKKYYSAMQLFFSCFTLDSTKVSCQPVLHQAASNCLAFPVLSFLLASGVDTTEQNEFGYTALHAAAENNNLLAVKALLLVNSDSPKPFDKKDLDMIFAKHIGLGYCESAAVNTKNNSGQTALHIAARGGHHQVVESLVLAGADLNVADENGRTPLHLACSMGWCAVVQVLITTSDIEAKCDWHFDRQHYFTEMTPLHLAVLENETAICEMLLDIGADIKSCFQSRNSQLTTAIHLSIFNKKWDTTMMLISRGSDVNAASSDNITPLTMALNGQAPHRVNKALLIAGANANAVCPLYTRIISPLESAVFSLHHGPGTVDLLLDFGADVNLIKPSGRTVLHEMVSHFPRLNNPKNFIHLLETSKRLELLLESTKLDGLSDQFRPNICDFAKTDLEGNSILHTALTVDNSACLNLLLQHVSKPLILELSKKGKSLLQVAVAKRKHGIVRHLLEMGVNIEDQMAWLQLLKLEDEDMLLVFSEFAKDAIKLNLPLDSEESVHGSLLHHTVIHSSEAYFSRILSLNLVDVNELDSLGRTSFFLAVEGRRTNLALSLLSKGASVKKALEYRDEVGRDLLHITTSTSQKMLLSLLTLHTPDIDRRALHFDMEENVTPLHIAAIVGQAEVIDILLRSGSDVGCVTSSGKDAKQLALQHGHELICQKLDPEVKMFQDDSQFKFSPETSL